ncbi:MAG: ABC transporter permease [Dehalococcoidia bacterium]
MTEATVTMAPSGETVPAISPRRRAIRSLLGKKLALLAIAYLCIFYFVGMAAPLVAPQDPNAQHLTVEDRLRGPSSEHWLGTDRLGRDLASRVIYATRTTVLFTLVVTLTGGLFLGLGLGLLSGYRGGWIDTAVMRSGEILGAVPALFLMLALMAAFRTRIDDLSFWLKENTFLTDTGEARAFVQFFIIALVTVPFSWLGSARIVRSISLQLREQTFVEAAELCGASTWRVITRHILPGVMPLWLVGLTAGMAGIAGAEVALSFLGLGITPPTASFGNLIAQGAGPKTFSDFPHLLLAPGVPVVLFFFAWNLLGDALVDILEPRLGGGG